MKTIARIFFAFLLGFSTLAQAQQSIECIYKWDLNHTTSSQPLTDEGFIILSIMGTEAIVQDYSTYRLDSIRTISNVTTESIEQYQKDVYSVASFFDTKILQDFMTQKMVAVENILLDRYRYEEPILSAWEMGDDIKTIAGYECHSASVNYGGRHWTVWYTEEIPIPSGPWKLSGLPGLILHAEDSEGEIVFDIAMIRNGSGIKSSLPNDRGIIRGKRDEIISLRNRVVSKPFENIPVESISNIEGIKTPNGSNVLLVNNTPIRMYQNGYIPLEKE